MTGWGWFKSGALLSNSARYLWVEDGTRGRAMVLPSSVSIRDALENYAEDYVIGSARQDVIVTYQMWQNGEIKVSGKHTFEVK